jgi:hypothetical protein
MNHAILDQADLTPDEIRIDADSARRLVYAYRSLQALHDGRLVLIGVSKDADEGHASSPVPPPM